MSEGFIENLNAVAPGDTSTAGTQTFKSMPANLTASAVLKTLSALGLQIPTKMTAAIGLGQQLRSAGHKFPLKELDAAMSKANVPLTDRFRLKSAMTENAILGS